MEDLPALYVCNPCAKIRGIGADGLTPLASQARQPGRRGGGPPGGVGYPWFFVANQQINRKRRHWDGCAKRWQSPPLLLCPSCPRFKTVRSQAPFPSSYIRCFVSLNCPSPPTLSVFGVPNIKQRCCLPGTTTTAVAAAMRPCPPCRQHYHHHHHHHHHHRKSVMMAMTRTTYRISTAFKWAEEPP